MNNVASVEDGFIGLLDCFSMSYWWQWVTFGWLWGDAWHKLATPAKITMCDFHNVSSMSSLVDIRHHFGDAGVAFYGAI